MQDRRRIGFDRTIAAEWLDAAVARVMTGEPADATRKFLWEFLQGVEPGTTNNSSRGKTLTVLTRSGCPFRTQAEPLKRAALKCVASASTAEKADRGSIGRWLPALIPSFSTWQCTSGKLIKMHGQANRSQIKRRMTESWGDRSTLERTIQHVLRSMAQWGLLRAGREQGSLVGPIRRISLGDEVGQLVLQAVLLGYGKGLSLSHLADHPALFPFAVQVTAQGLMGNPLFRVQRQGDRSDFVDLLPEPRFTAHLQTSSVG